MNLLDPPMALLDRIPSAISHLMFNSFNRHVKCDRLPSAEKAICSTIGSGMGLWVVWVIGITVSGLTGRCKAAVYDIEAGRGRSFPSAVSGVVID